MYMFRVKTLFNFSSFERPFKKDVTSSDSHILIEFAHKGSNANFAGPSMECLEDFGRILAACTRNRANVVPPYICKLPDRARTRVNYSLIQFSRRWKVLLEG